MVAKHSLHTEIRDSQSGLTKEVKVPFVTLGKYLNMLISIGELTCVFSVETLPFLMFRLDLQENSL